MLTLESLKKYHAKLEERISYYDSIPVENLTVSISNGNIKIGNVPNVSLPADKTCPHCKDCQFACYDKKACLQYPNVMNARAKNYSIMKRSLRQYFEQIKAWLQKSKCDFFRFHVGGDISSKEYLDGMVSITNDVKKHAWTYTKAQDTVNEYIASHGGEWRKLAPNLVIMYSKWGYAPINNPYNMPVFWCIVKGQEPPKDMYHCPGNCRTCIENKRGCPYGESAWTYEH